MTYTASWLARIFQLATPFEFRSSQMSVEACVRRIDELDRPKESFFTGHTLTASTFRSVDDEFQYLITLVQQRQEENGYYISAELTGELRRDPETDATLIVGKVQMGQGAVRRMILSAIFAVGSTWLFSNMQSVDILAWLFPVLSSVISGYYGVTAFYDRKDLLATVGKIMATSPSSTTKPKNDLADGDEMIEMTFQDGLSDVEASEPDKQSKSQ